MRGGGERDVSSAAERTVALTRLLDGEVKTPPLSAAARVEAGFLLRQLQQGVRLGMPHSRPMPSIGTRCHELRINDVAVT